MVFFKENTEVFRNIIKKKKSILKQKQRKLRFFLKNTWPLINLTGLIGLIGAPRGRRLGGLRPFSPVDAAAPGNFRPRAGAAEAHPQVGGAAANGGERPAATPAPEHVETEFRVLIGSQRGKLSISKPALKRLEKTIKTGGHYHFPW